MTPAPDVHLFHARRTAAGFEVSGDHAASFGHRLAGRGDRAQDDGIWAGWHWDGQRLRIESCRFGLYPLFVLQRAIRMGDGDHLHEYFTRTRAIRRGIIEAGQDTSAPDFGRSQTPDRSD